MYWRAIPIIHHHHYQYNYPLLVLSIYYVPLSPNQYYNEVSILEAPWAPAASAWGPVLPVSTWKSCKVFWCISNDSRHSVDELFMHCFQNIRWRLGALPQTPIKALFMDSTEVGSPGLLIRPPLKKSCRCPCNPLQWMQWLPYILCYQSLLTVIIIRL